MAARSGVKPRARHELVMLAFHPLVAPGVRLLTALGARPEQVVVAHGLVGLAAAALITTSSPLAWAAAAVLLQAKTVLDNLDGSLARATGRVTELGRYLDTGVDLIVNAALFAALATHVTPWAAIAAFAVLTFLLSYDYNVEGLHRAANGRPHGPVDAAGGGASGTAPTGIEHVALVFFRGLYSVLLAPQDRAVRALERFMFRMASGQEVGAARADLVARWWDVRSTALLVNLGLSTQYVLLGACLVAGRPYAYVWLVLAEGVYLVGVLCYRFITLRGHLGPHGVRP